MDAVSIILSTAGGLALFLYGLRVLSDALKRAIGERMRSLLERLTGKPYRGVIVGAVTSGILQSSSMTMVLLIGLINAGALTLAQGIGVMLGSEIGTTLTAQIVAFKIGHYYLPIIAVGFLLAEIFRGKKAGDVGRIILGFGLLFLGMSILSGGLKGLAQSATVLNLLESIGTNVWLGVLVGAGVTAVIQSSSAMTAIVIAMGAAGVLSLPAALIFGANIGTTITAQIASLGSSLSSRRLAVAQLMVNILGVAVFLPFVGPFASLVERTATSLPRQIANAHTIFNITVTLALIPTVGFLVWLVTRIVRGRESTMTATPQFLSSEFLSTPAVALHQARNELLRMADMTAAMLKSCEDGILNRSPGDAASVLEVEVAVDGLQEEIEHYLDKIPFDALSDREAGRLHVLQHVTGDIERVGDHAVNIAERTRKLLKAKVCFSETAQKELRKMFSTTRTLYARSLDALRDEDRDAAEESLQMEKNVDQLEHEYKANHIKRVEEGVCDPNSGMLYVEILHNLERVGDHAVNVAGDVLHVL